MLTPVSSVNRRISEGGGGAPPVSICTSWANLKRWAWESMVSIVIGAPHIYLISCLYCKIIRYTFTFIILIYTYARCWMSINPNRCAENSKNWTLNSNSNIIQVCYVPGYEVEYGVCLHMPHEVGASSKVS